MSANSAGDEGAAKRGPDEGGADGQAKRQRVTDDGSGPAFTAASLTASAAAPPPAACTDGAKDASVGEAQSSAATAPVAAAATAVTTAAAAAGATAATATSSTSAAAPSSSSSSSTSEETKAGAPSSTSSAPGAVEDLGAAMGLAAGQRLEMLWNLADPADPSATVPVWWGATLAGRKTAQSTGGGADGEASGSTTHTFADEETSDRLTAQLYEITYVV